jgi:hypothetical protein
MYLDAQILELGQSWAAERHRRGAMTSSVGVTDLTGAIWMIVEECELTPPSIFLPSTHFFSRGALSTASPS